MAEIAAAFDNQLIHPSTTLELPCQCTQAPHDPYLPDGPGWNVGHMPDGVGGVNWTFCSINVILQAAATSYSNTHPDADDVGWV